MVEFPGDKNAVGADLFGNAMQRGHADCGNTGAFKFF